MPYILSLLTLLLLGSTDHACAHAIDYQVAEQGISARFFYAPEAPANYAGYEIYGPGDTIPHQKGRTDRNGFVSFLPDRPGKWRIEVVDEGEHGAHGARITITVDAGLSMASFDKPLVARHTAAFVGTSLLLFCFSVWVLFGKRKRETG